MRKIYAAIGHFKDTKNISSVAFRQNTKKDFMFDCSRNEFAAYVVLTETMIEKIFSLESSWDVYEQVKKLTTNYRVWNEVTEYITQAGYLVTEKVEALRANPED